MLFVFESLACKRLALVLVGLILLPVTAIPQEIIVTDIKVVGNEHISTEAIKSAIALKPGMPFSEQAVEEAKKAIEGLGYFQPGITVGTETTESGVQVVFNVVENPVVKEINITGNTVYTADVLRGLMVTSVGKVLNNATLEKDLAEIENHYAKDGYFAFVSESIGIDPQTGVLTIPIMETRIESIKIVGNKKTKEYVIRRAMELKPGDVYNERASTRDLQRVFDLGYFEPEGTGIRPEVGSQPGLVNLTVTVNERKTGEVSIGVGYSSKTKLVGQAKLSEANLQGRGQTASVLWEQTANRGASYELSFFEPWLDNQRTSVGVNLYNKLMYRFTNTFLGGASAEVGDYDERRKGGSITLSRPFGPFNRGFLTFRTEEVDAGVSDVASLLTTDGKVSSGTFRFTTDRRDSIVDPFGGGYNSYAIELGDASFSGLTLPEESTTFAKYSIDLRRYFSRGGERKDITEQRPRLALRVMAGGLTGKVPFFEQYFVGGAETLRGFREDRFWGKNILLASAEYRFPLAQSLTGVGFVDFGDAWGADSRFLSVTGLEEFTQHEKFKGNLGYGVGIRVVTPIGPLRLDYGFSNEGSRAHFSIGHAF